MPGPVVEEGTGNGGVGGRAGVGLYFARGEFHGRFGKDLGPVYLRTVRVLGTVSNRRRRRPRRSVSNCPLHPVHPVHCGLEGFLWFRQGSFLSWKIIGGI